MIFRLIYFALALVLKLLMFKVCGIIGISKIEFFNFSGAERVNDVLNLTKVNGFSKAVALMCSVKRSS